MKFKNFAMLSDEAELDGTVNAEALPDSAVDAIVEDPVGPAAEVAAEADEIEAAGGQMEEASEDGDAMSDAGDALTASAEAGEALPPLAAEAFRILTDRLKKRNGVAGRGSLGVESFKNKSNRIAATRIAGEDLKDMAKDVWKKIVKLYEKVIAWVKKTWANLTDGATKLKNRAEALEKAAGAKGAAKAEKKIDNASLIEALQVDGVVGPAITIETSADLVTSAGWVDDYSKGASAAMEKAAAAMESMDSGNISTKVGEVITALKGELGNNSAGGYENGEIPDGWAWNLEISGMFANKAIYSLMPKDPAAESAREDMGRMKVVLDTEFGAKDTNATEMDALTAAEVKTVAGSVKAAAVKLIAAKGAVDKINAVADKVKQKANKLASGAKDDDKKDGLRTAQKMARLCLSLTSSATVTLRSKILTDGNHVLSYGAASLALIGKKDDKAAA